MCNICIMIDVISMKDHFVLAVFKSSYRLQTFIQFWHFACAPDMCSVLDLPYLDT